MVDIITQHRDEREGDADQHGNACEVSRKGQSKDVLKASVRLSADVEGDSKISQSRGVSTLENCEQSNTMQLTLQIPGCINLGC